MILLDTNVVSEFMKSDPEPAVMVWINALPGATLFLSAVTQAEILYGVALVPKGKRRDGLTRAARTAFETYFRARILPLDPEAAEAFATLAAGRHQAWPADFTGGRTDCGDRPVTWRGTRHPQRAGF
jgi:predicted nucleic acid-binding protein